LIDGIDTRNSKIVHEKKQVGLFTRCIPVFSTIKAYAFGKDECITEEVKAAAKSARIDDFIDTLPMI